MSHPDQTIRMRHWLLAPCAVLKERSAARRVPTPKMEIRLSGVTAVRVEPEAPARLVIVPRGVGPVQLVALGRRRLRRTLEPVRDRNLVAGRFSRSQPSGSRTYSALDRLSTPGLLSLARRREAPASLHPDEWPKRGTEDGSHLRDQERERPGENPGIERCRAWSSAVAAAPMSNRRGFSRCADDTPRRRGSPSRHRSARRAPSAGRELRQGTARRGSELAGSGGSC